MQSVWFWILNAKYAHANTRFVGVTDTYSSSVLICFRCTRAEWSPMICLSALGFISGASILVCFPLFLNIIRHKCSCPVAPLCPDCGMPYWLGTRFVFDGAEEPRLKMICMTCATAIVAAGLIACGPVFCEKFLKCFFQSAKKWFGVF